VSARRYVSASLIWSTGRSDTGSRLMRMGTNRGISDADHTHRSRSTTRPPDASYPLVRMNVNTTLDFKRARSGLLRGT
jgi:hypothetical protein